MLYEELLSVAAVPVAFVQVAAFQLTSAALHVTEPDRPVRIQGGTEHALHALPVAPSAAVALQNHVQHRERNEREQNCDVVR